METRTERQFKLALIATFSHKKTNVFSIATKSARLIEETLAFYHEHDNPFEDT